LEKLENTKTALFGEDWELHEIGFLKFQ